jgi:5-methylthioribose kinase
MTQEPPFPLITIDNPKLLRFAMEQLGLWDAAETIESVEQAGDGNMNAVLRVVTDQRRVILKQSRPWVEKYPQIAAPADRIFAEINFYQRVLSNPHVRESMPKMLASSAELYLMAMEDLGKASDYSDLYSDRSPEAMPLEPSLTWLVQLHSIPVDASQPDEVGNRVLRELNHAHIFQIPLQSPSAIPLDQICDGLEHLASDVRSDTTIHRAAQKLGEVYLGTGENLLHGDFYPGSWLRASGEFRVIDPEFCFAGPLEFDLAVLAAHRVLIGGDEGSIAVISEAYERLGGANVDLDLLHGFAAMEVIRRLIGVAQLPLRASLEDRATMIQIARSWLVG